MNEKALKILGVFFVLVVLLSICNKRERQPRSETTRAPQEQYNVNVQTVVSASEGLNLMAVGELLKQAQDGQEFERLLNSPNNGVNNLDLDEDGKVDYIFVTEYGDNRVKGFSLTTQPAAGEVQEIATIEVEKSGDQANVQVQGNEQIYGRNHYYHSSFGLMDFVILSWLFQPRPLFASPYGYNNYPDSYRPHNTTTAQNYRRAMNRTTQGSSFSSSTQSRVNANVRSPNAGKSATSVKAPLKNPTSSQRAFQARNPSQQVRSGGFGRQQSSSSTSRSTTRSSSVRRSAPSRSGGFSRGGK
ncbi:hypothetical protein EH223_10935 [candidate division KSB1 bacterium]|nr:hypothetical protein [candidate division KSB1 bacterium]RQW03136.1 MAG: hypothetical protein EH223_10935 [candidate division KSB1 bacterium]